jgi:transcriptional regulator with GAF, ATPase, and Fis domain
MNPADLQMTALRVAEARSIQAVLDGIVQGLAREAAMAMVRIWLLRKGDQCDTCLLRNDCPQEVDCLQLVASAGQSIADPTVRWASIDGRFRRIPVNVRKVGQVGGTGEALLLRFDPDEATWPADPDWMQSEGIRVFAGQPLLFRGEVLGVLAVFSREEVSEEGFGWLRTFADHGAVALANARAFEEIAELRDQLEMERDYLRSELDVARTHMGLIGESPALLQIEQQVEMVAPTEASVLVQGESGTGKELIASAIHERSQRADRPMVRVNCASIPHELFESEFFGHAKDAFTGALSERAGRFSVANGGTLFLDEVGEIPLELQGKLLRVLQEGQFSRVGEDSVRSIDVRVIAATNRDLKQEAAAGLFRQDLYYRLSVFPLQVPPLRERREDIPLLAAHFLREATSRRTSEGLVLRKRDVQALLAYDWPGNVRELQNVIERAVILSTADRLHIDLAPSASSVTHSSPQEVPAGRILTEAELHDLERRNLIAALVRTEGKVSGPKGAAELLGVKSTTLNSRMKKLGIKRQH